MLRIKNGLRHLKKSIVSGLIFLVMMLSLFPVSAYASVETEEENRVPPFTVVVTTGMIADAVRTIGGAYVQVDSLMGAGVDPHGYRQTRSDVLRLARADLIFWHGLSLEAQMEDLMHTLSRKKPVIPVAESLSPSLLRAHPTYADKYDPHIWMNPMLWRQAVLEIKKALCDFYPQGTQVFSDNTQTYLAALERLDRYARASLETIPTSKRVLVTAHDAFAYFGKAYNLEVIGLQGISTQSEVGLQRISEVVDFLVTHQIESVFVESSVSDQTMRALVEGARARGHMLSIGAELFSDAMGQEGTYEGTYPGMMDYNITHITNSLGGQVPHAGMNARLTSGVVVKR